MERYDPKRMELSTRDVVARAIYTEVKEGRGTPHGGVYLDVSHLPADDVQAASCRACTTSSWSSPASTSPRSRWRSARPATTSWAAIKVDAETGASRVPGLFATGECSGGMNGANRLGGNSLSDLLVFGQRAGEGAAATRATGAGGAVLDAGAGRRRGSGDDGLPRRPGRRGPLRAARRAAGDDAETTSASSATRPGLTAAIAELDDADERAPQRPRAASRASCYNPGWHLCRDLRNMLDRAREAVARAALMREESRGAHSRLDFPELRRLLGRAQHRGPPGGRRDVAGAAAGRQARRARAARRAARRERRSAR